jgi:quinoprotein glucose dehydrogenase
VAPELRRILLAVAAALLLAGCGESYETSGGQWPAYGGDSGGMKYSPLSQIDAGNFAQLEITWTWEAPEGRWRDELRRRKAAGETIEFAVAPDEMQITGFQVTPLMIDGVLYGITPMSRLFALDAGTGAPRWEHDPHVERAAVDWTTLLLPKHRGISYWRKGDDARILVPTSDAWFLALDASTGIPVQGFGNGGRVDLLEGLRRQGVRRLADYLQTGPGAVFENVFVVGSAVFDRPTMRDQVPGDIRGYDIPSGKLLWTFHVVPDAGEPGVETWGEESWRVTGAANAWGPMTVDQELGYVYIVTSSATDDGYGGHRPGNNLYAESLLCLEARTGKLVWHQQLIHHGVWDYDPSSPPNLVDLVVDGRSIGAVAAPTKQGFVFVFDRRTGEPVWPIEERPVPASDVPGEIAAPTQRFPLKPPAFERQGMSEGDLIDFTPEILAQAKRIFTRYRTGPLFTPPSKRGTLFLPGSSGGASWRGAGWDPETHVLYVPSITMAFMIAVSPTDRPAEKTIVNPPGDAGWDAANEHRPELRYVIREQRPVALPNGTWTAEGLPLVKPPYSRITAIALDRGEIVWQVPNGEGPRNHPRLAHLNLPRLGSGAPTCVLVTKTLLFATDGGDNFLYNLGGPVFRAYDKKTGALVGEIGVGARIQGCPMTYMHDGRQFIVMATADEKRVPTLVALALPPAK